MSYYKVGDDFFNQLDVLLDSLAEMSQSTDTLCSMGVALVNLKKLEAVRNAATTLNDELEDGFETIGKDDEDEEDTEDCTDPGDDDPAAVFNDPDGAGCDSDAD